MYYKICFLSVITIYDILFLLNVLQFFGACDYYFLNIGIHLKFLF